MSPTSITQSEFRNLALIEPVLKALHDVGYETPTPIQARTIPFVLEGRDVIGQAQTGTGKTAAFALPLLSRIDLKQMAPQVLVLTPTRELTIQVAEAFQRYAAHMKGFHVLPIYGGQSYEGQFHHLKRGVHVVVGTPGRLMDHMRRGTLNVDFLRCLVLDEADEMLRMGFIDDVEWILEQTPSERQIALFSATMPETIRRIAKKHLKNPEEIIFEVRATSAKTIRQRYWMVSESHKLDALTRLLEAEALDGMLVFVRTKIQTEELAAKLNARGFVCAPLNGDIPQNRRERTIESFKAGKFDILVATDVAARGLDVERISHVINYDIPYDTEAYVHRIGRTGRAGRSGEAILMVTPRERRLLREIEKATHQKIDRMTLPSTEAINNKRIAQFKERITDALSVNELGIYYQLVEQYQNEHNVPVMEIAAALAKIAQGDKPFLLDNLPEIHESEMDDRLRKKKPSSGRDRSTSSHEDNMDRFRIEVGKTSKVKQSNIVGAIANETGIDSSLIGKIFIYDDYSTVDLPQNLPKEIIQILKKVWVSGKQLRITKLSESGISERAKPRDKFSRDKFKSNGKKPKSYPQKKKTK